MVQSREWFDKAKVPKGDRVRAEHETLGKALFYAICYDQLNVSELASMEMPTLRLQMLEQAYSEDPLNRRFEHTSKWMGAGARGDGAPIDPRRRQEVPSEVEEGADVLKEKRKARGELALKPK